MKHIINENSYRKAVCCCLQSRYVRWWAISKNLCVFNFAIFVNSRKSRKFNAREIYMVYSIQSDSITVDGFLKDFFFSEPTTVS